MSTTYVMQGGRSGKDRLKRLSEATHEQTMQMISQLNIKPGSNILDAGCGGGDVTIMLADITGPTGSVLGTDLDDSIIRLNQADVEKCGIRQVRFETLNVYELSDTDVYDLVFSRYMLAHLDKPLKAVQNMMAACRPGGTVAIMDVDLSGAFCYPECAAFQQCISWIRQLLHGYGADANIGLRVKELLGQAGVQNIQIRLLQPDGCQELIKEIPYLNLLSIQSSLLDAQLATQADIDTALTELLNFSKQPDILISPARIFQAWGSK